MVWEWIEIFLDEGLFEEFDMFKQYCCIEFGMDQQYIFGDGVVMGWGMVNGCIIYVFLKDFIVFGGFLLEVYVEKIIKFQDMVLQNWVLVIGFFDVGGVWIQEGVVVLGGYGEVFICNVQVFGVIL